MKRAYDKEMERLDREFSMRCNSSVPKAALKAASSVENSKWHPLSVMGLVIDAYNTKFGTTWKATREMARDLYGVCQLRVKEDGAEYTIESVKLLFSDSMYWINNHIDFFQNRSLMCRFVYPTLDKEMGKRARRNGEQSEWTKKPMAGVVRKAVL